ncbi:MAG: alpha-amylase, partial [Anaerolineae bacterium]|nr:alpha-amylase [Anaerolineae bacterium]
MKKNFFVLILIALLSACTPTQPEPAPITPTSPAVEEVPTPSNISWWDDAIFYEIFVRSFYDSDNDGIGDFNGITAKLNYLEDLGINAIWLMPIPPSPSYHGYDVINYYAVNHEYGTMDDFKNLLEEAHKRDIRIIIDLVLNHTSSQHPFFVDASNNPESPYRDWYVWSDEYPGWGGKLWHETNHGYYYALFWERMPDLNYQNLEVTEQMEQVARYWLDDIGVDGFRLDAIKHLIEEGGITENTTATHKWLKEFYRNYKAENPETYVVGEVHGAGGTIASTYINQMDHVFNFELASGFVNSANGGSNTGINSAYHFTLEKMPDGNYATFLTNHDQNRAMSVFYGDVGKAKVAASLMLTAPGTPFIYYGEEIGMLGKKPDEDIRLPMRWSGTENAGFSGSKLWHTGESGDSATNVKIQENDPASLLS